jgi:hypothetical protein
MNMVLVSLALTDPVTKRVGKMITAIFLLRWSGKKSAISGMSRASSTTGISDAARPCELIRLQ